MVISHTSTDTDAKRLWPFADADVERRLLSVHTPGETVLDVHRFSLFSLNL